jgi:prepilin-type N-terminal cleavage/methylation domain-containing protein
VESQRGFTLIEMVVTVAIVSVLLLAGGVWMMGAHPGALRNALDDFDAQLAAGKAIAAASGNGATLAFLPNPSCASQCGFALQVYAGRPTSPGAVTSTSVRALRSRHFGSNAGRASLCDFSQQRGLSQWRQTLPVAGYTRHCGVHRDRAAAALSEWRFRVDVYESPGCQSGAHPSV